MKKPKPVEIKKGRKVYNIKDAPLLFPELFYNSKVKQKKG